jgi:hypothetical protein
MSARAVVLRVAGIATVGACALVLAGCGESSQVIRYQQGKYQGKTDSKPWDNEPSPFSVSGLTKGDRIAWETQIKTRNQNQNEYQRAE